MILVWDVMVTCKFPIDSGIMSCSHLWSLVFFEQWYVKLKTQWQVSTKTLLYWNLLENLANLTGCDEKTNEKTNVNTLAKDAFTYHFSQS